VRWRLLALDFDRTLTSHPFGVHPKAPEALARLRQAGVRVVVCSGQPLPRLQRSLPEMDGWGAENGCIVWAPGKGSPWVDPWPDRHRVAAALLAAGIPHTSFDVVFDVPRVHEAELSALLPPGARAIPNVDQVNVQPANATKGTALAMLQKLLEVPREATIALGDGENDVPMFQQAGLALAVANATGPAKAAAHRVLDLADGEAVVALAEELLAGKLLPA
jgi:hydroxymethylpyrimidine pyrophosphatase-like HAD family hydrolase